MICCVCECSFCRAGSPRAWVYESPTRQEHKFLPCRKLQPPRIFEVFALFLSATHFRMAWRLLVDLGSAVELSLGEDRFFTWLLVSLVGLVSSALVVSLAILPPSFSHRSSILFFRRFLAIGSGIGESSFFCVPSNQSSNFTSFSPVVRTIIAVEF